MMIVPARWVLLLALVAGLFPRSISAGPTETDEILRLLPANMAGCLVIEDFADNAQHIANTQTFKKILVHQSVKRWLESQNYQSFEKLIEFLPFYFGIPNDKLAHDILGESVVLAFRPARDNEPAAGLIAFRAQNQQTLDEVLRQITLEIANRKVTPIDYKGVSFVRREEFDGRVDYLLRLGSIVILSDKRNVIEEVIETSTKGSSLYDIASIRDMRSAVGDNAFVQIYLNPRPFDPLLEEAVARLQGPEQYFAKWFVDIWRHLDAAAISVHVTDHLELSIHSSMDIHKIPAADKRWAEFFAAPSSLWDQVPADALFAMVSNVDIYDAVRRFSELSTLVPELAALKNTFDQLAAGLPAGNDVFRHLGPQVGAIGRVNDAGRIEATFDIELRPETQADDAGLTLAQRFEWTILRPIFVFYSVDLNSQLQDTSHVDTLQTPTGRWHVLRGSRLLPAWFEPGFSLSKDWLTFSTNTAPTTRQSGVLAWKDSPAGKRFRQTVGDKDVPKGMVNFQRLADYVGTNRREIVGDISKQANLDAQNVDGSIDELASLLRLADSAVLSTATEGNLRRWTISLFPIEDSPTK